MLQFGGWQNKKIINVAHRRQSTTAINNRIYIKTVRLWQTIYKQFELIHTRVTGNTLIWVFIITLIWVLKAVSNKQERTTLNN